MPQIDLNVGVPIPASLLQAELIRLLTAIEKEQSPFEDFAINADFSDLHLPSAGAISVPIELRRMQQHGSDGMHFTFRAKQHDTLFPTFHGSLSVEPAGSPYSCVRLRGEYKPPMGTVGRVVNTTVLRSVAERSLRAFLDRVTTTAESNIRRREADIAQAQRFGP